MKIISKFHDYYDYLTCYSDKNVFYRKFETIPVNYEKKQIYWTDDISYGFMKVYINFCNLFFCGKDYPYVKVCFNSYETCSKFSTKYFFNELEYYDFIVELNNQIVSSPEFKRAFSFRKRETLLQACFRKYSFSDEIITRNAYNEPFPILSNSEKELLQKDFPVAYLITSYHEILIYPKLDELGFYNIVSAEEAYQEIEYYLFNILNKSDADVPVGTDVEILESKGFDRKNSFRKEKSK